MAGPLGAAKQSGWESEAEKLLAIAKRGEAATVKAMADDEEAEREMHDEADALMDITEKYVQLLPAKEAREYFDLLSDADLQSEHEPFD